MIRWDLEKAQKLWRERGIDLNEVAKIIEKGAYIGIFKVPSQSKHPGQKMFILEIDGYVCCVPFVIEENGGIFIKTAYQSRKLNTKYGNKED